MAYFGSMEIRSLIEGYFPVFKEEGLIKEMAEKGSMVDVGQGDQILREGQYVKTIPLLVKGAIKVVRQEGIKEILLYHIYPKESCIVSIQCGLNHSKSEVKAFAEEDTRALLIPSQYISGWKRTYPSFSDYILWVYEKRFYSLLNAFNALAFQSLDKRLEQFLLAKKAILKRKKVEMTHQEIAEELGAARESVSRIMKKLESEGKIKIYRGGIEISGV